MQHRTGNIGRLLSTREGNFCFHMGGGNCLTISFSRTVHNAAHYVRCTGSDLGGCLCAASKYSSAFSCKNWWEQQNTCTAIGTADAAAKTRNMRPTSRRRGTFEGVKTACTACCITSCIYDGLWTISITVFLDVRLGTSILYTYNWGSRSLRNVDQYLQGYLVSHSSRHHHHHHHLSFMEFGHLLTCSGLTYPEASSKIYHDSFFQLRYKGYWCVIL